MIDLMTQIWVTVCGLPAIGLCQARARRVRRWGSVLGLIGQPAWYVQLAIHEQWAMIPVFIGYTGVWIFGFWNHWMRKEKPTP